jgi:hypothetical protein
MFFGLNDVAFLAAAAAGPALWTPADITTALWLDAADASTVSTLSSLVTEWRDKSGNARHLTQSDNSLRPSYVSADLNGNNVVGTATTGKQLGNSNAALLRNVTAVSVFLVASSTSTTATTKIFLQIGTATAITRFGFNKSTNNFMQSGGRRLNADSFAGLESSVDIGTGYNLLATVGNYATTTLTNYRNGSQDSQRIDWLTSGSTPNDGGGIALFNSNLVDSGNMTGNIAEIVLVESAASTDTRQRIEGYLAHKWGLTANLPNDHPYKTAAPTV